MKAALARPTRGASGGSWGSHVTRQPARRLGAGVPTDWDAPSDRHRLHADSPLTPSPQSTLSPPSRLHSIPFAPAVMFPPHPATLAPYSHPQLAANLIAPSQPPPISHHPQSSPAGLTLTVTAGEDISRVLRFDKLDTPVINIGRMPSSRVNELELDLDLDLAWFRCAVVSRKHAKICFADSGHVSTLVLMFPLAVAGTVPTPPGLSHRSILPSRHPLTQGRAHRSHSPRSRGPYPACRRRYRHLWQVCWQGCRSRSSRFSQGQVPASASRPRRRISTHSHPKVEFWPLWRPH